MRSLLTLLFWTITIPLGALVAFPWTLITRDSRLVYWLGTHIAWAGVRIAGVKIEVVGLEQIDPAKTYIFLSNHASNLDPPILIPLIPRRSSVLVKQELFKIPVLGRAMRIASLVAVDRGNQGRAIASLQAARKVLEAGINMTIFVEGTRSPNGRLLPFKKGPFYLALESGVPVIPVTIVNTHTLLPKGKRMASSGWVSVIFHPAIDSKNFPDKDALLAAVRERIASALPFEQS
jgi:1-acyl-sn-glycerol-3-phosphate acyltransferase